MKKLLSLLFVCLLATSVSAAPPTAHDGSGTETFTLDWSTMVTETNPASARYRIINGTTAGDWTSWTVTNGDATDAVLDIPETTENVTIELEVTDLAGNTNDYATDALVIPYSTEVTNLLTNGDFEAGSAGWDISAASVVSGVLVFSGSGYATSDGAGAFIPANGVTYNYSIDVANLGVDTELTIRTYNSTSETYRVLAQITTNGTNTGTFSGQAGDANFQLLPSNSSGVDVDNFIVW